MAPVLLDGDWLEVRREALDRVHRGDVVLVCSKSGAPNMRLVAADGPPLRTVSMNGRADRGPLEFIGRVMRIRRGAVILPLPPWSRWLVWAMYLGRQRTFDSAAGRATRRALKRVGAGKLQRARRSRRWKNALVRPLAVEDGQTLVDFADQYLQIPSRFLRLQLIRRWPLVGAAVGAFDRKGEMCGFAYLDEFQQEGMAIDGWWVRSVFVIPAARRLGIAERLLNELCVIGRSRGIVLARADIPAANVASQRLFQKLGFKPSDAQWHERLTRAWAANGVEDAWAVLERVLD